MALHRLLVFVFALDKHSFPANLARLIPIATLLHRLASFACQPRLLNVILELRNKTLNPDDVITKVMGTAIDDLVGFWSSKRFFYGPPVSFWTPCNGIAFKLANVVEAVEPRRHMDREGVYVW